MQKTHQSDLACFHRFISIRLEIGDPALTPEEALDLWRAENPSRAEFEETTVAIREAVREMDSGDAGVPLDDFDREFRRIRGLGSET
jgi:hypothetical protein